MGLKRPIDATFCASSLYMPFLVLMTEIILTPEIQIFLFVLGTCFGSLVTLLSWRLPRDEKVGAVRSQCPACKTKLGMRDLVPVLSWVLAKGKCRYCGTGVHWRYPVIELLTGAATLGLAYITGVTILYLWVLILVISVITLIVTDLEHYIIPDELQIVMLIAGIGFCISAEVPYEVPVYGFVTGAAVGLGLKYGYLFLRNKDGLGMGDVKLLAVVGVWLGAEALVPFLFYSGVVGVLSALIWRALGKGEVFPFGPALAITLVVCLLFPQAPDAFWHLDRYIG